MFDNILAGIIYLCLFLWLAIYVDSFLIAIGCVVALMVSYIIIDHFKNKLKNKKKRK